MKKVIFLISILILMFAGSLTAYAEEKQEIIIEGTSYGAEARVALWGSINTTSGRIGVPVGTVIPGASSYYVRLLQCSLFKLGYDCKGTDGIYGTNTKNAIMSFQRASPTLSVDGIAGQNTWLNIFSALGGAQVEF